jgi:hypothetical protein
MLDLGLKYCNKSEAGECKTFAHFSFVDCCSCFLPPYFLAKNKKPFGSKKVNQIFLSSSPKNAAVSQTIARENQIKGTARNFIQ